jgi:hypothetical protein
MMVFIWPNLKDFKKRSICGTCRGGVFDFSEVSSYEKCPLDFYLKGIGHTVHIIETSNLI